MILDRVDDVDKTDKVTHNVVDSPNSKTLVYYIDLCPLFGVCPF